MEISLSDLWKASCLDFRQVSSRDPVCQAKITSATSSTSVTQTELKTMSKWNTIPYSVIEGLELKVRELVKTQGFNLAYEEFLTEMLVDQAVKTVCKFKMGNDEHGGNFFRCDFDREIRAEILDLSVYQYGKQLKDKYADRVDEYLKASGKDSKRR